MTSIEDIIRLLEAARETGSSASPSTERAASPSSKKKSSSSKKKRKPSAYAQRYGRAFKKLAPKYKTKAGKWKKDGFKRCQKAAHREAKR